MTTTTSPIHRGHATDQQFSERNAGIDLIRGLSIIMVMLNHIAIRIPLAKTDLALFLPKAFLIQLSYYGYESVFVFFVVSGFLIARNTIQRWGALSQVDPMVFYARRAARILPCLVVLVGILSLLDLMKTPYYTIRRPDQSLERAIISVFGLHLNWYEGHTGYLPGGWDVLWSLSIEEVFYLGFPLFCIAFGRNRLFNILLFGTAAFALPLALNAVANAPEIWREKAYFPGMSAIAMGGAGGARYGGDSKTH